MRVSRVEEDKNLTNSETDFFIKLLSEIALAGVGFFLLTFIIFT